MRHGDKINNLGRTKSHRVAMMSNMASQLITHKRIVTTLAKAKALRTYVEPLITKTKKDASKEQIMHNPRLVFELGIRLGDNAERAMIELVDFNEIYGKGIGEAAAPAKKTRRSGGAKKKSESAPADEASTGTTEASSEETAAE
jgi:large subunit ribosomal protein L17